LAARPIVLIATAQSTTSFHHLLSASHLLGERVVLRAPDKVARREVSANSFHFVVVFSRELYLLEILAALLEAKTSNSGIKANAIEPIAISTQTDGYLPADLRDLIDRAIHQAAIRAGKQRSVRLASTRAVLVADVEWVLKQAVELSLADFDAAQREFVPLSLRDVKLQKSEVEWADIGGMFDLRV
jgi:peroxin-1